jgi:RNA polymerase sigma-70 factor (ECF subfamily)
METRSTVPATTVSIGIAPDEHDQVVALLAGDEEAFGQLVDRYYPAMLQVARGFVRTRSAAEEVVQETLLAVVEGLARFEGRSSLKTWMFRILVSRAKTRGRRQRRRVTFGCLRANRGSRHDDPVRPRTPALVTTGSATPVLNQELVEAVSTAMDRLPARERTVLVLRDVQGWTSSEVCEVLGLTDANQRLLLHRGRIRVHALLVRSLN